DLYGIADAALVGGSFAAYGGHNAAEPAALGVPVVIGPDHATTADAVDALVARRGGRVAVNAHEVADALHAWLAPATAGAGAGTEAVRAGQAARAAVESLGGASDRTLGFLEAGGFWG